LTLEISIEEIIQKYECILFDAFGVLLDGSGAFPEAQALITHLNQINKPYFVVTNGSKFPARVSAQRYRSHGLKISDQQVISSGSLIEPWFVENQLQGCRCGVLGPESSRQLIREAGATVVTDFQENFDVLVVCDQSEVALPAALDDAISALYRQFDQGFAPKMLLPNPDLIYPKGAAKYGITSGSLALVIEAALSLRYRNDPRTKFICLGKPHTPIFQQALSRSGTKNMALIGDQIDTDIIGANRFGIDSILMESGISAFAEALDPHSLTTPKYWLRSLKRS
jgi:HAD superfamily hydrolase (TIGR01450 family)